MKQIYNLHERNDIIMSNTLETKTIEQLSIALQSYNTYMCEIPEKFNVLEEYLHGLTALDFAPPLKNCKKSW